MPLPRKFRISDFGFRIWQFNKGFTLIELLIVISIIAILVASATYSWRNAQEKGRDGKRKSDLKAVQQALELYFQNNGQYPASANGKIQCNVTGDATIIEWGKEFACTESGQKVTYMQQLPKDPTGKTDPSDLQGESYYYATGGSLQYTLSAKLENIKDPDLVGLSCTPQNPRKYCVINP